MVITPMLICRLADRNTCDHPQKRADNLCHGKPTGTAVQQLGKHTAQDGIKDSSNRRKEFTVFIQTFDIGCIVRRCCRLQWQYAAGGFAVTPNSRGRRGHDGVMVRMLEAQHLRPR